MKPGMGEGVTLLFLFFEVRLMVQLASGLGSVAGGLISQWLVGS